MRRGFKTEAERVAAEYRAQIDCGDTGQIDLGRLARYIDVRLMAADELLPRRKLEELHELQPGAFSAGTFNIANGQRVVVFNPLHSKGRQRSDIAHEFGHIILNHKVRRIESVGDLRLVTCDVQQEEEADWFGGCLLLPRALLLNCARSGFTAAQVARHHETSEEMAKFRLNTSGVLVQVGREKAARERRQSSRR